MDRLSLFQSVKMTLIRKRGSLDVLPVVKEKSEHTASSHLVAVKGLFVTCYVYSSTALSTRGNIYKETFSQLSRNFQSSEDDRQANQQFTAKHDKSPINSLTETGFAQCERQQAQDN